MAAEQSINGQITCPRCDYCSCATSDAGTRVMRRSNRNRNTGISCDAETRPERPRTARSNYSKSKRSKSSGRLSVGRCQNRDNNGNHRQLYSVKEVVEPEDSEQSGVDEDEREQNYHSSNFSDEEPLLQQEKPKKRHCVSRFFTNLGKWF